jgi:RNA polymerase sigma-70 factor (ECF subfamily)
MGVTSLRTLYELHGHDVHRRALYLLGNPDEAWDATQEVFLRAEKGLGGFEARSSLRTWLVRITTHHCLNLLRSRRVRQGKGQVDPETLDTSLFERPDPELCMERAQLVRSLLAHFDPETQAMAVHHFVDEMTLEEVAETTGRSVPTVRKRLREFVERAQRRLANGGGPHGHA